MNMPDAGAVAARIRENPAYVDLYKTLFGSNVMGDDQAVLQGTAQALAAYQRSSEFAPFDSRYDRYMRGEVQLTPLEQFGRAVFVTWNCQSCHTPMYRGNAGLELFTSFDHHNIGVPNDPLLPPDAQPAAAGVAPGMFKTPTLRNIAVTGPYMHNGSIRELGTALRFYNRYLAETPVAQTNPETGKPWAEVPHPDSLSRQELESGIALSEGRLVALEAFLKTLTDQRYEHLLQDR
jgi:cytochrome c peroxidase